jgi:2,3-bisphosphoglycerate-dependent phosphoglycerate mutase
MREILLMRHAAASGQGADAALTTEGRQQASELADVLLSLGSQRLVSSPFRRAIESVEPFAQRVGLSIETDERLVERVLSARNLPDWRDHLRRSFEDLDYCLYDGESARAAQERGVAALLAASAGIERCAVVTHGNLLALILKWVDETVGYECWAQLSNPDLFVIQLDRAQRSFRRAWP